MDRTDRELWLDIFDGFYTGDILDGGKKARELAAWHVEEIAKAKVDVAEYIAGCLDIETESYFIIGEMVSRCNTIIKQNKDE